MNKKKLTAEEQVEKFWEQVEEQSKWDIYSVLTRNIPLQNVPLIVDNFNVGGMKKVEQVSKKIGFFPDKDTDYRVILRDQVPNYYEDHEEYQQKISTGQWDSEDVRQVAEQVSMWYLLSVMKGFIRSLSAYDFYEDYYFTNLTQD